MTSDGRANSVDRESESASAPPVLGSVTFVGSPGPSASRRKSAPPTLRLVDAYAANQPLFARLHTHVRGLPDVPKSFAGKYELMADP